MSGRQFVSGWIAVLLVCLTFADPARSEVEFAPFASPQLEKAVRLSAGRPMGPLTAIDLARITRLQLSDQGIEALGGIERLSNLTELDLRGNRIADLRPLQTLRQLQVLDVRGNPLHAPQASRVIVAIDVQRTGVLSFEAPGWPYIQSACVHSGRYTWTVDGASTNVIPGEETLGWDRHAWTPHVSRWTWGFAPGDRACKEGTSFEQKVTVSYADGAFAVDTVTSDMSAFLYTDAGEAPGSLHALSGLVDLTSLRVDRLLGDDLSVVAALPGLTEFTVGAPSDANEAKEWEAAARVAAHPPVQTVPTEQDLSVIARLYGYELIELRPDGSFVPVVQGMAELPLQVETAHSVVRGERSVGIGRLYVAAAAADRVRPLVEQDLGVKVPTGRTCMRFRAVKERWQEEFQPARLLGSGDWVDEGSCWEYATWRNTPTLGNFAMRQTHDALLKLVHVPWPKWLQEGIPAVEGWRIGSGSAGYGKEIVEGPWGMVLRPDHAPSQVPTLATLKQGDPYVYTATANLLENHGGSHALSRFLPEIDRQGFAPAFAAAFGLTPEAFQAEYEALVAKRRSAAN